MLFLWHPLPAQTDIDRGLAGYWPFDSSGVNESPNRLPATDFQLFNTSYTYGFDGAQNPAGALYFYGDGYAYLANGLGAGKVAFSLWFNTDDSKGGALLGWDEKGYGATLMQGGRVYAFLHLSSNNLYDFVYDKVNLADGKWHNVIGSFDGYTFKVYVDGAEVFTDNRQGGNRQVYYEPGGICLGGFPAAIDKKCYTGKLDELMIFNRGLTAQEVAVLAGKGKVSPDEDLETGLLVYLPFQNDDANASPNVVEATAIVASGGSFANSCQQPTTDTDKMKFLNGKEEYLSGGEALQLPQASLGFFLNTNSAKESFLAGWDSAGYELILNPPDNRDKLFVRLWVSETEAYTFTSTENLNDGQCHYLSLTFDGNRFRVFIDGKLGTEDNQYGSGREIYYGGARFLIGNDARGSRGLQGKLDEFCLYNRALKAEEVKKLMAAGPKNDALLSWRIYGGSRIDGQISENAGAFFSISNYTGETKRVLVLDAKQGGKPLWDEKVKPGENRLARLPKPGKASDFEIKTK